jgi:hypothetical protein
MTLRVYGAQITSFEEAAIQAFVDRMVLHLTRFFPRESAAMGDAALRALIREGIDRAAAHGVVTQRETCKYLTLMVAFGRDFDRAPWAAAILGDAAIASPFKRVARLYEAAIRAAPPRDERP